LFWLTSLWTAAPTMSLSCFVTHAQTDRSRWLENDSWGWYWSQTED
jgi:hypothetical protein